MKLKSNFITHESGDGLLMISAGGSFNGMVRSNSTAKDIINLLKDHVYDSISLDEISRQTFYSKTFLNGIFRKNTGFSIMKYYFFVTKLLV